MASKLQPHPPSASNPSPIDYNLPDTKDPRGHKFSLSRRDAVERHREVPGPGVYDVAGRPVPREGVVFARERREALYRSDPVPGPGAY
jgi:hypothetical protein